MHIAIFQQQYLRFTKAGKGLRPRQFWQQFCVLSGMSRAADEGGRLERLVSILQFSIERNLVANFDCSLTCI